MYPVVVYSSYHGTYLGSSVSKVCGTCKLYEHYSFWSHGRKKNFTKDCLQLDFLLSSEDTASQLALLRQYSQLPVLGALPFSTFAASYNRRFNYHSVYPEFGDDELPKVKRQKK